MVRWLRRLSQAFFLGLFLFFVAVTTAPWIGQRPVEWFLALDPLVALTIALSTHSLPRPLLWAVPLTVLTLFFGRFFCGWMCPTGVLHHLLGHLGRAKQPAARIAANAWRPRAHRTKYLLLVAVVAMAAAGSVQIGLLDPIASTWRALSVSVLPALSNTAFGIYQGERHFQWSTFIALVFFGSLALNLVFPRLYCRVLCPLGALLGLFAKLSLFRVTKDAQRCNNCGVCSVACSGGADPQGTPRAAECVLCLNCLGDACPRGALKYRFLPLEGTTGAVDLSRRHWLTTAVAAVAAVPVARASDGVEPRPHPRRIRPPGALDEKAFLERCLKCGACMKVCPTGGLQPSLVETGVEGLWTPVLVPRMGFCEHACTLCGQVCPTGAIRKLTVPEKAGDGQEPVRIGSAALDKGRCLPWANDTECLVCEEVCPTPRKAIYLKAETVKLRDGAEKTLKRPFVDLEQCIGCGTCESRCPVFDSAGIRVSSVGETRSATNQVVLTGRI